MSARRIRVLTLPDYQDEFLSRPGDSISVDVPGGRVTLRCSGGWSQSGIGYFHLEYEASRQGLVRPTSRGASDVH